MLGVAGEGRTGSEITIFWFRLAQGDVAPLAAPAAAGDFREGVKTDGRVALLVAALGEAAQRVSTNGRVLVAVALIWIWVAAKRASTDGCVVLALVLEAIARAISQGRLGVPFSLVTDPESGIVKERFKADRSAFEAVLVLVERTTSQARVRRSQFQVFFCNWSDILKERFKADGRVVVAELVT